MSFSGLTMSQWLPQPSDYKDAIHRSLFISLPWSLSYLTLCHRHGPLALRRMSSIHPRSLCQLCSHFWREVRPIQPWRLSSHVLLGLPPCLPPRQIWVGSCVLIPSPQGTPDFLCLALILYLTSLPTCLSPVWVPSTQHRECLTSRKLSGTFLAGALSLSARTSPPLPCHGPPHISDPESQQKTVAWELRIDSLGLS